MKPKIKWNPSKKDLRGFGKVLIIGFGIIAGVLALKGKTSAALWVAGVAGSIGLLALIAPVASTPFYWIWMGFAFVMGSIMSRVLLSLIFYVILTPVAVFFKLTKRDLLRRDPNPKPETYWVEHPALDDPDYYRHLF